MKSAARSSGFSPPTLPSQRLTGAAKFLHGENRDGGGDSDDVAKQLHKNVQTISSTRSAFAALKNNGNIITWETQNKVAIQVMLKT